MIATLVQVQDGVSGIDHHVCYYSNTFNKHQNKYSTIEKETQAQSLALQHFEVCLSTSSCPIVVYIDHSRLTFLYKMRNKTRNNNQRLMRCSLTIQTFNLDIKRIKGKNNVIADALS